MYTKILILFLEIYPKLLHFYKLTLYCMCRLVLPVLPVNMTVLLQEVDRTYSYQGEFIQEKVTPAGS